MKKAKISAVGVKSALWKYWRHCINVPTKSLGLVQVIVTKNKVMKRNSFKSSKGWLIVGFPKGVTAPFFLVQYSSGQYPKLFKALLSESKHKDVKTLF